jgi:WD40 repeat protein
MDKKLSKFFVPFICGPTGPVGIQMTRKEKLHFIMMSGMIRKLVERLSWMSRRNWQQMMVSLEPIIIGDNHVSSLTFDPTTSIVTVGWNTCSIRIIFPNATFITKKMNRSVSNVTVLGPDLFGVCCYERYALILQRNGDTLQEIGQFRHEILSEEDSVDVCCCDPNTGIIATADYSGGIKIWSIDGCHPKLHCDLKGHTRAVTRMMFQPKSNMLLSLDSSGKAIFWVLTEDGTRVLSSTALMLREGKIKTFAFVPDTNMVVFGLNGPKIEFWSYEVNSDNQVVTNFLLQKTLEDSGIDLIKSISFHPDFPAILIGTGTLEDGKRVPAYLLSWGARSSGEIFVDVLKTFGSFFRYSTLVWAYGRPWIGN